MGLTRQAVQRVVNELASAGLLALTDNPDHERARLVGLTEDGRKTYEEIMAEQVRWSNKLAEEMSPRTIESAVRVLETLRNRLENLR